jgi:hypothetical protein
VDGAPWWGQLSRSLVIESEKSGQDGTLRAGRPLYNAAQPALKLNILLDFRPVRPPSDEIEPRVDRRFLKHKDHQEAESTSCKWDADATTAHRSV